MALSALALVRLIGTLHQSILLLEFEASVRKYIPVNAHVKKAAHDAHRTIRAVDAFCHEWYGCTERDFKDNNNNKNC